MAKLAKKNKGKGGDPEKPYWKELPGAPVGQNIASKPIQGKGTKVNLVNEN